MPRAPSLHLNPVLLKTPKGSYKFKLLSNADADLPGLDTVDNGVHERWYQ